MSPNLLPLLAAALLVVLGTGSGVFARSADAYFTQQRAAKPSDEPKQKWGYASVRHGANMFWWLYYSTQDMNTVRDDDVPLVIWLQGGPGGSSTGFGNFMEIGPLDINLKPRETTWLSAAHLLFIDNPVGVGYSYVTSDDAYTKDVHQIATDLVVLMQHFMKEEPEFQTKPLFIFSESYGGKMTAAFGQALNKAIEAGSIKCNLKGVGLGDSWIAPMDYVLTWGPYLYATSLVDAEGLRAINDSAMMCKKTYDAGNYSLSTEYWSKTEDVIEAKAAGVNFYNILNWGESPMSTPHAKNHLGRLHERHVKPLANDALSDLMNGPIRDKLKIIPENVTWGGQSGKVFQYQSEDFMKPVYDIVDDLLINTKLKVAVYNGQLDLICDTMGTEIWVQRLKWSELDAFNKSPRKTLKREEDNQPWGFVKQYDDLSFYWILDAGHMVPSDVGEAALAMLKRVIGED